MEQMYMGERCGREQIRTAQKEDYDRVRKFYHSLIDEMADSPFLPGWKKDIYPAPGFLQTSIEQGELYIKEENGELAACMVLNHACNPGYENMQWSLEASSEEMLVIHALGVAPRMSGRGIAKEMVKTAFDIAREQKLKTVRLDILKGNLPAKKAYLAMGFRYVDTVEMFYEDTGWTDYEGYEYVIPYK